MGILHCPHATLQVFREKTFVVALVRDPGWQLFDEHREIGDRDLLQVVVFDLRNRTR